MRVQFILSEIGIGLRRNLSMTISVILVTFVSLTFVGAAILTQGQIQKFKGEWYDKVEITVYLCPRDSTVPSCASGEATDDQIAAVEDVLESPEVSPEIRDVMFESKQDAWVSFEQNFSDRWWFSEMSVDDMNASFRIKLTDPEEYQVINEVLTGRAGVEEVRDQREIYEPLFDVLTKATLVASGLAGVMLLAAVLLITTTIRLSALSRKRETGIMRLVGASTLFIQLPFMLEGAIAATIGALLACVALWAGVHYLVEGWLGSNMDWIPYVTTQDVLLVAPWLVAAAILLAAISSLVTLSRYTKV
ncbi:permease-like cell division protein FtsX [Jonesia denitrificans]|uniref:Cell division protein FtsX n=1 Tax=Jonesia denitrificans (strain ATCC 14870 / DSM 20603 / BCRC 15368 / CIP 55.134 / JCM 11481 / NBRC 15587 / NCTC 10816 / Prevot 55134) TaxID=471856 RepID=C7R2F6_JONDD|nr:permease-like cell division protein FtsX [Jonesia denitrificans]ACV08527.1 cell division protein FtsX [Jonesia denitrificans DSM 20603]ASE07835.1 ABC transporter permease [Jonesia denitrificans]QXB42445.1 permease-like cell division protein FtsX [Jonesia denitrificans]SQH20509.1 Cell division protein FtsX [Jonesia denitrificans]